MNNYCTVFGGQRGVLKTMYKFIQRNHRQCILHDKAESDSADQMEYYRLHFVKFDTEYYLLLYCACQCEVCNA